MAGYVPTPSPPRQLVGQYPTPQTRRNTVQPLRRAGSGGSFDRGWHGDMESSLRDIGAAMDRGVSTMGNILLYRGVRQPQQQQQQQSRLGSPQPRSVTVRRAIGPGSRGAIGPGTPTPGLNPGGPRIMGELMPGPPVHVMNSQGTGSAIPTGAAAPFQPQLGLDWGRQPQPDVEPTKRQRRPKGVDPRTRNAQQTLF